MKLAYWQHNRPAFSGLPVRFSNGVAELVVNHKSNDNNYLDNTSASKTLTADGRFHFDMSVAPERFYFWKGSNQPVSCEMFFPEITLEPHGTWNVMTILQEIPAY